MEVVFSQALAIGFTVHLSTALLLGEKADRLPGGAIGAAVVLTPVWVSIPAAVLGQVCGVCLRKYLTA